MKTAKYKTKLAFTIGKEKFYEFSDAREMPFTRAMNFILVEQEMSLKVSYKDLIAYTDAISNALGGTRTGNDTKIDIFAIYELNKHLKEKLKYAFAPDLVYKISSIFFFSENEDPATFDPEQARKNIALWKANETSHAFFLREPIQRLLPYLKDLKENLPPFLETAEQVDELHGKFLLSKLSPSQSEAYNQQSSTSFLTETQAII